MTPEESAAARAGPEELASKVSAPLTRWDRRNDVQSCLLGPGRRGRRHRGPPPGRDGVSLLYLDASFYKPGATSGRFPRKWALRGSRRRPPLAARLCRQRQQERHLLWHAIAALAEESATCRGSAFS